METKKFTQTGTFSIAVFIPALAFLIFLFFRMLKTGSDDIAPLVVLPFILVTLLLCLLIFYKLTIYIDDNTLSFSLGTGIISKKYLISDITSCKPVKNSALYGIGIRALPDGWLYNVSGLSAIELTFKNRKSIVRIGTDKPEEISDLVNSLIQKVNPAAESVMPPKSRSLAFWLSLSLPLVLSLLLILSGNRDLRVDVRAGDFEIAGMYGITIKYSDIVSLDTITKLPGINLRTNGYAFGKTLKGNFMLSDNSQAKLFIKKGSAPFIHLETKEVNLYLNFEDPYKTVILFDSIFGHWRDGNK